MGNSVQQRRAVCIGHFSILGVKASERNSQRLKLLSEVFFFFFNFSQFQFEEVRQENLHTIM